MNNIITVNPEEFLEGSRARHFMIILTTPDFNAFFTPPNDFVNVEMGPMDSPAISRTELVKQYYSASRFAKETHPVGRLDIVELPSFSAQ